MSVTKFLTAAIGAALELGVGTADDVLRHVTPDVLGQHLPRPLWARLITACLGASKTDAQLVVDTIGVANLCEHMPGSVMWNVLADIAQKALGRSSSVMPGKGATASGVITSPAPSSGSQPIAASGTIDARADSPRSRSSSRQPFRSVQTSGGGSSSSSTGAGASSRGGSALGSRRPQAAATPIPTPAPTTGSGATTSPSPAPASALVGSRVTPPSNRRGTTNTDFDIDTDVRAEAWKKGSGEVEVEVVDDDQLIDWSSAEETVTGADYDQRGNPRKP
jgi:hypothetical protein